MSVAKPGPTPDIVNTRSKILSDVCSSSTTTTMVTGFSIGIITRRYTCHSVAPSMRAASRTSSEIVAMPPIYMAITNPESCQVAAIATGMSATGIPSCTWSLLAAGQTEASTSLTLKRMDGSVVQPGLSGARPDCVSTALIPKRSKNRLMPVSGLKIQRQTTPVTTNDRA